MTKYFKPKETPFYQKNVTMIQALNYNTSFTNFTKMSQDNNISSKQVLSVRDDLIARIQKLVLVQQERQKDS